MMRRGDLVTIALPGDFGKPRPALIIQSDQLAGTGSVTVLLISNTWVDAPLIRLDMEATLENGLQRHFQIMVDKPMTVKRERVGEAFGDLDDSAMVAVNRALAVFLGFA